MRFRLMPRVASGRKAILAVALVGCGAVLLAGCTKPQGGTGGPGSGGKTSITLRGSDTMLQLAQAWQEEYVKKNPDVEINVNGGGSGTGIKALMNKTADIANSSRPMEEKEKETVVKGGAEPKEFVVAQDGLAIVVNPGNPVTELTVAQVKEIYQGKTTNWNQVGGPDQKITVNSRESSSGTFKFFQEHVLDKEPFADSIQLHPSTNAIVQNVAADKGGIGYVGLGYVNETVKTVKVKPDAKAPGVDPTVENVLNKSYPLSRPLYMYTAGEPTAGAKAFIEWVRGAEGQAVVEKQEFVPVK